MAKISASLRVAFCCLFFIGFSSSLPTNETALTARDHEIYQCPDPSKVATPPLCSFNIKESGGFFQIKKRTVNCPDGAGINTARITCIIVRDNMDNEKGGYASITDGGLNEYAVSIFLESQRGQGLDNLIQIYTEKAEEPTTTPKP